MGGGGQGNSDVENTIRYAQYIEAKHDLWLQEHERLWTTKKAVDSDYYDSPYATFTDLEYLDGFFGVGYTLSSFPSLYDMFGKFAAGLDIDGLYTQILDDSINNTAIDDRVSAHAIELEDEIENNVLPRFTAGMRDINSVISSTFVVGKAMLENARIKALSKYDTELRVTMIPVAAQRWATHLTWNRGVVQDYSQILKFYFSTAMDITDFNYTAATKHRLWPFTILDFQRAAFGALQGATKSTTKAQGESDGQVRIAGALTGAVSGAMIGATVSPDKVTGAAVGGLAGGLLGLASGVF